MKTNLHRIAGQNSWKIATGEIEAYVTETGGHLGPVTFKLGAKKIQPFSVAPWAEEETDPDLPAILKVLRGDFFCMPFGGNATPLRGEKHPVHGETANNKWILDSITSGEIRLSMKTKVRPGLVQKIVQLRPGHSAIYQRHVISGMSGLMNMGHHAMVRFPDYPGSGRLTMSRFLRGHTLPVIFERPEDRGYSRFVPGKTFTSLARVPMETGEFADLSSYPARRGFEDLVMIEDDPQQPFAWVAVTFPKEGYVWFALKDPRVLLARVLWLSNGGRHYPPWSGRHINVLGIEEVTSYFHFGLAESVRKNPVADKGTPTAVRLDRRKPLDVRYIMAMAAVPRGFDEVAAIERGESGESVVLTARSGRTINCAVDAGFLAS